jgi:hypothetical protein
MHELPAASAHIDNDFETTAADDEQKRNRDSRSLAKGAGFDALRNARVTIGLGDRDTGPAPKIPRPTRGTARA